MKKIPIIFGPTAVGKTRYAIEVALKDNYQVISADSMQVYKEMNIGTAKPSKEEMQGIKHHLIDIITPDTEWNVFKFVKEARKLLFETSDKYLIVGGTGLYIRSLIYNFSSTKLEPNADLRKKYKDISSCKGTEELYKILQKVDVVSSEKIKPKDEYRIIRALEVYELTGIPFSEQQRMDVNFAENFQLICLNTERQDLYNKINQRVDKMVSLGLFDEVKYLLDKGYKKELPSMQALGYKEVVRYLEGQLTKDECIELIKRKTRNFAKRQLTWYRSFPKVDWSSVL